MKRFLSWVVLFVLMDVFCFASDYFWRLALYIGRDIYSASSALLWVLIILEGSVVGGIIIGGLSIGSELILLASQKIWQSKKGARYIVATVVFGLWLVFMIWAWVFGILSTGDEAHYILTLITDGIFILIIPFRGLAMAKEDGPQVTKEELLQRQIDELRGQTPAPSAPRGDTKE